MIDRYSIKEITDIWSDENKFLTWLNIEKSLLEFYCLKEVISFEKYRHLISNLNFEIKDIWDEEEKTKHDVVAFLNVISKKVNIEEKKWIHYGLTSSDIVDTGNSILLKKTNDLIIKEFYKLTNSLSEISKKYLNIPGVARTHGMHAEITSLSHQFMSYQSDIKIGLELFNLSRKHIECIKMSGSVGNYAHTSMEIELFLAKKFDLHIPDITTQILSRERHYIYFHAINLLAQTINKMATNLRLLSLSEVAEVSETFSDNQIGSSSMPHKKNPIILENICGLSRIINSYALISTNNISLWHERDISHSSTERIMLKEAPCLLINICRKIEKIISSLDYNLNSVQKNINISKNNIYSQRVLSMLIAKTPYSREELLIKLKNLSLKVAKNNSDFIEELLNPTFELSSYLNEKDLIEIKNNDYFLKNNQLIYDRVFSQKNIEGECSEIIWSKADIENAIDKIANQLNYEYKKETINLICLLDGAIPFVGNLLPKLNFNINLISCKLNLYKSTDKLNKNVNFDLDLKEFENHLNESFLILDDLYDTGSTIAKLKESLNNIGIKKIKCCTLFSKVNEADDLNWYCLKIPNKWAVGYGLDSKKQYRNANFLGILKT